MPNSPSVKEGIYGQVPDLPPRVDRAAKPMGILTTPSKYCYNVLLNLLPKARLPFCSIFQLKVLETRLWYSEKKTHR